VLLEIELVIGGGVGGRDASIEGEEGAAGTEVPSLFGTSFLLLVLAPVPAPAGDEHNIDAFSSKYANSSLVISVHSFASSACEEQTNSKTKVMGG